MSAFRRFAAVSVASLIVVGGASPALADDVTIPDPGGAVVGLAYDANTSQIYAVSDVDSATVLVTDVSGGRVGTISLGDTPESIQGLAFHDGHIYAGDVGGERSEITVYRFAPELGNVSYQAYDFTYPDGAHDAKAVLVSGKGRIYVITDGENPGVYRAELDPSRSSMNPLTRAGDAPEGVTDAVFLPDGGTMLLRTALGIETIDAYEWAPLATTTYEGAPDGESVTSYGDNRYLVGSTTLRDEAVPTSNSTVAIGETPSPEPSVVEPTATESPTAEVTEAAPVVEESTSAPRRGGTIFALAAAGVLALACGALVYFRRT